MSEERENGNSLHCIVRLWLVIEEDRGLGPTIRAGYATEDEAIAAARGSHEYIDWVDIPLTTLEALKPN